MILFLAIGGMAQSDLSFATHIVRLKPELHKRSAMQVIAALAGNPTHPRCPGSLACRP